MPLSLGTFTLGSSTTIPSGFSSANNFDVTASGLTTASGKIAKKNGSGTIKGVIVFFSISDGSSYWDLNSTADTDGFFDDLAAAGYHSVMVTFTAGWTLAANGVASGQVALAIRPATAIKWVYDNWYATLSPLPTPGLGETGFCVTGLSGGSAAITYALEMYDDLADIINVCIPTSGPPMAQIGKGCIQDASYDYTVNNDKLIDNSYGYDASYGNEASGPCLLHTNTAPQLAIWAANSVETCGTIYLYPTTRVHIIEGASDTAVLRAHITDYHNVLTGTGQPMLTKETVTGMGHIITDSQPGLDALYDAITAPATPVGPPARQAASAGRNDVNFAINGGGPDSNGTTWTAAVDGDTISIPAGTADWTQQITVSKAITIQGQSNVIGDHTTALWIAGGPPETIRSTVIRDAVADGVPQNQRGLFKLTHPVGSGLCRITGITFLDAGIHARWASGLISPQAGSDTFRVDHCEFDDVQIEIVWAWNDQGLIDHCSAINMNNIFVHHKPMNWGGGSNNFGDGSYGAALDLGGANAIYLEDCYYRTTNARSVTDGESGARIVSRFNVFVGGGCQNHGAEAGQNRSGRKFENYNNRYIKQTGVNAANAANFYRGGTGIVFGNTVDQSGSGFKAVLTLVNYRDGQQQSWDKPSNAGSDGLSGWDINDTVGGLYLSGTHSATGGTDSLTLKVDGATWTTDQWSGYTVKNLDRLNAIIPPTPLIGYIVSNSANVLTLITTGAGAFQLKFSPGNRFEIRRVFHSLDHCGAGQSDLLTAASRATPHDINQIREPIYCFDNTLGGALYGAQTSYNIRPNVDFYNQVTSFNGTVGIGVGLLVDRPTTCSTGTNPATGAPILGVGYWATDQGEWDSTNPGNDGQLYVCTAADTWSLYYKPYTYPHTLISNEVAIPLLSPLAGAYVVVGSTKDITATTSTSGAQMRYTTDGTTTPSATVGTLIASTSGIITLGIGTTTIQIIAFASGMDLSSINTSVYTVTTDTTRIISLGTPDGVQSGLLFGPIIVGLTGSLVLRIFNTGSAALNVSSITYPTGYTGTYAGAIALDSYHDVTVVFTPVSAIAYNGTITVNSDATSGTNTIFVTGRGTPAASGIGGILPGTRRKIGLMTE